MTPHRPDPIEDGITQDTVPIFDREGVQALPAEQMGFKEYEKKKPILATRILGPFRVQTIHQGVVTCEDGWLAIDQAGYPYPIDAAEFEKIYELVGGDEVIGG